METTMSLEEEVEVLDLHLFSKPDAPRGLFSGWGLGFILTLGLFKFSDWGLGFVTKLTALDVKKGIG